MHLRREKLVALLDDLAQVADAAEAQAALAVNNNARTQAFAIKAELDAALGEACVQSRKRSQDKDVPAEVTMPGGNHNANDADLDPEAITVGFNGVRDAVHP